MSILKRNYKREGMLPKGSGREWWSAKFNVFIINVVSQPNGLWKAHIVTGNGIKNYDALSTKRLAYGAALADIRQTLEYDITVIDSEYDKLINKD